MEALTFDIATVFKIIGWTAGIVGFALAIKFGLNGVRKDIKDIRKDVHETKGMVQKLVASDAKQDNRLTKLETEVVERRGWIRRIEDGAKEQYQAAMADIKTLFGIIERRKLRREE